MLIKDILTDDMDRRQIDEDAMLIDAIDVMKTDRCKCLLVTNEEGKAVGILSEHDIVMAFDSEGDNAKTSYIADYMTTGIISLQENQSVESAIDLMTDKGIRHIPVVGEDDRVSGFLSIMELLKAQKAAA